MPELLSKTTRLLPVFLLALAASVPLAVSGGGLPSSELGDGYKHLWSFWHTSAAIAEGNWPWTPFLNAPSGGLLLDVMLVPSLLLMPISETMGPLPAVRVWIWMSLFLTGLCQLKLCEELGFTTSSSTAAALSLLGLPYLAGYPLASGVYERLSVWIFPLVLLVALRAVSGRSRRRDLLLLGAGSLVVAFSCAAYFLYAVLLLLICTPAICLRSRKRWRKLVPLAALLGLVSLAALGTAAWLSLDPWSLAPQPTRFAFGVQGIYEAASPAGIFSPFHARLQTGVDSGDWLLRTSYIGWSALGLALLGMREARARWAVVAGLLFLLLSMGPSIPLPGISLPNPPYLLLAACLPFYGSVPDVFQQSAVAGSLLAVGMAGALSGRGASITVCALALVLAERGFSLPPAALQSAKAEVPDIYRIVDGPIADVPRQYRGRQLASGRVFLAQMLHRQPIPYSVYVGVTAWDSYAGTASGKPERWERTLRCLGRSGFRWLMVHRDWFADASDSRGLEALSLRHPPDADDGTRALFRLLDFQGGEAPSLLPFQPGPAAEGSLAGLSDEVFGRMQPKCPMGEGAQ
jgi:hypothetical protein